MLVLGWGTASVHSHFSDGILALASRPQCVSTWLIYPSVFLKSVILLVEFGCESTSSSPHRSESIKGAYKEGNLGDVVVCF